MDWYNNMADFDPTAYLNDTSVTTEPIKTDQVQTNQFDPENYLNDKDNSEFSELQSKYGDLPNQALAGVTGLASGLTLGGSDVALTKSGLISPEKLRGLQEANPLTSTGMKMVGGAGLIGATGGASGVAEGAGTLAPIIETGLEGGVFGAGNAVNDYALGDPNLNAQKILAHVGTGILGGLALGSLGKAIEVGIPPSIKNLNKSLENLKSLTIGTEENPGLISKVLPDNIIDSIFQGLKKNNEGSLTVPQKLYNNFRDIFNYSKKATNEMYETVNNNINDALENIPPEAAQQNLDNSLQNLQGIAGGITSENPSSGALSSTKSSKLVNNFLEDFSDNIENAKTTQDKYSIARDAATDLDKIIPFDTVPTASNIQDKNVLSNLKTSLRNDLSNTELWGEAGSHYAQASKLYNERMPLMENFQKAFMMKQATSSGKDYILNPGKITSFFKNFNEDSQTLKKDIMNNFIKSAKNIAEESENYAGFQKGSDSISDHINSLADKNEELAKIAQAMSNKTLSSDSFIPAAIAHAVGVPNPAIIAGTLMAKVANSIKNPYELGSSLQNTFTKLKVVGDILQKSGDAISAGTKSIFTNNSTRGAISNLSSNLSNSKYNKNIKTLNKLNNNPNEIINHLTNNTNALAEAAPNITSSIHSTMIRGLDFLNSKMPKPSSSLPLSSNWEPSNSQKAEFNKYYDAVDNPMNSIKQIKNGTLSNQTMEALYNVHPDLLKQMQSEVIENMSSNKLKSLNYPTKISINKFLGPQVLSSSLNPQVILSNQASFNLPAQTQKLSGSKSKSNKEKSLGNSKRSATLTERMSDDE